MRWPHFSRSVGEYLVPVFEFHSEHGVRQHLGHRAVKFNGFFLSHVISSRMPGADRAAPQLAARLARLAPKARRKDLLIRSWMPQVAARCDISPV